MLDATSQGPFQVEVVGGSLRQLVPQEVDGVARGRLDGLLQQLVQAPGEAVSFWVLPHSVRDGKGRAGPSEDVDDFFVSVEHGAITFQIESERPDFKSDHRSGAKSLGQRALEVPRVHSALKVRD
ncbi:Glycoside hydrolase 2 (Mannanase- beta-galactosidase) [Apiospora arundinis]